MLKNCRMKARIVLALATVPLTGCSSPNPVVREQVKIDTRPGGAVCTLNRQGKTIGEIAGTPGFTTIDKTWYDLTVRCDKAGYRQAVYRLRGQAAGMFFGNGARKAFDDPSDPVNFYDASYDVVVRLDLVPTGAVAPTPTQKPQWACPVTSSQKTDLTGCVLLR
jgi:hypothetical protein